MTIYEQNSLPVHQPIVLTRMLYVNSPHRLSILVPYMRVAPILTIGSCVQADHLPLSASHSLNNRWHEQTGKNSRFIRHLLPSRNHRFFGHQRLTS